MAICQYCEQEMHAANGCVKLPVKTIDGPLDPVLYGSEIGNPPEPEGHRCHDCGALPGYYHHAGCDWEQCPRCHDQLISCDCQPVDDESSEAEAEKKTEDR